MAWVNIPTRDGQLLSLHADDSSEVKPTDVLVFKHKNAALLDSVIISKAKKKPKWITITTGPITTMYRVGTGDGRLKETAKIHWPTDSSGEKKAEVLVEIDGETFPAEKFGRTKGHLPGKPSERRFLIDNLHCKWRQTSFTPRGDHDVLGLYWECTADIPAAPNTVPSASTSSSSSSKWRSIFKGSHKSHEPKMLLARYRPPQGISRRDLGLDVFPDGAPHTFLLLLTIILICSHSDDWKVMQSERTAQEFEDVISSDVTGALPVYSPARDDGTAPDLHPVIPTTTTSRWQPRAPKDRRPRTAPDYYPV